MINNPLFKFHFINSFLSLVKTNFSSGSTSIDRILQWWWPLNLRIVLPVTVSHNIRDPSPYPASSFLPFLMNLSLDTPSSPLVWTMFSIYFSTFLLHSNSPDWAWLLKESINPMRTIITLNNFIMILLVIFCQWIINSSLDIY